MPEKTRLVPPRDIVSVHERFFEAQCSHSLYPTPLNSLHSTHTKNNNTSTLLQEPLRPYAWVCVFLYLRVSSVSAASLHLQRTSPMPAQAIACFEEGQKQVLYVCIQSECI